ncbi:uncharacterized protein LOC105391288 isoform X2 [Plutella xylostella]|uniref:uncharacterized protein LOC105391288 isoform X1 n=1 Tax=Plutella xylostella TaxID=51655 RepID=UPI0020323A39|nr:uncharacterized protein LOC105391288 isoform X1 [Plutella xylostella]XP_048489457.1 uncharacterized protein LOC105391288 isoform X2 [Plutella xylostella]
MMSFFVKFVAVLLFIQGVVSGRQLAADINRIKLPTHKPSDDASLNSTEVKSNAYVHHSGWRDSILRHPRARSPPAATLKVYQPREDPRLFYQSDAYAQENRLAERVSNEVAQVFPGREVIRAADEYGARNARILHKRRKSLSSVRGHHTCIRCPTDKKLIAPQGSDRVFLQQPYLKTCAGKPASRNIKLLHVYGPRFGTLVGTGTHVVVSRITEDNKIIRHCKTQVHVVSQGCRTPPHLVSRCEGRTCSFTCRDSGLHLQGTTELSCGQDMEWMGDLPDCVAHDSCPAPPPPDHGRISCHGDTGRLESSLLEGAECRVRCQRGWRSSTRVGPSYCRRGHWTKDFVCYPRRQKGTSYQSRNSL